MMPEKVYVVYRRGVYMQGIVGVFTSRIAAARATMWATEEEPDEHHTFETTELRLDFRVSLVDKDSWDWRSRKKIADNKKYRKSPNHDPKENN